MTCNDINLLTNCGKCLFSYDNAEVLKATNNLNISKSAANLLWTNDLLQFDNLDIQNYSILISCTGRITATIRGKKTQLNSNDVVYSYYTVLYSWLSVQKDNGYTNSTTEVRESLSLLNGRRNINKVRQEAIKLVKRLQSTVPVRLATRKIAETEISSFKLANVAAINRFTCFAIVSMLQDIAVYVDELDLPTHFINVEKCYVSIVGKVAFSVDLIHCESKLEELKRIYSLHLNSWCKSNFTRCIEIVKIKRSINIFNRQKSVVGIVQASAELIKDLRITYSTTTSQVKHLQ